MHDYVAYDTDDYVPVEINGGTQLNWRYYFPIDRDGAGTWFMRQVGLLSLMVNIISKHGSVYQSISNSTSLLQDVLKPTDVNWFIITDKAVHSWHGYQSNAEHIDRW